VAAPAVQQIAYAAAPAYAHYTNAAPAYAYGGYPAYAGAYAGYPYAGYPYAVAAPAKAE